MKKSIISIILLAILVMMSSNQKALSKEPIKNSYKEAIQTVKQFEKTSPFALDKKRTELLDKIQNYSDSLDHKAFAKYLAGTDEESISMEKTYPILYYYRHAFDEVLKEVKTTKVKKGTVAIWMLYNMGYIIKTSTTCFGIDINHRWDYMFEPYIDFLCVTHNHGDHKSVKLMEAMRKADKPVLSNFFEDDKEYCSKSPTQYKLGEFSIRTDITDHNEKLLNFITAFRIESDEIKLLHCGDSNFRTEQLGNVGGGEVNLLMLRYGSKEENNIVGTGSGQVIPNYVFLNHVIELRHRIDSSPRRRTIPSTLERASNIDCKNTVIPFWGEKMVWKNGKMYKD